MTRVKDGIWKGDMSSSLLKSSRTLRKREASSPLRSSARLSLELDRRLRDILADDFERKHGKSIRGDKRGMAKLWKEAGRIKAILSANTDARPTVFLSSATCNKE